MKKILLPALAVLAMHAPAMAAMSEADCQTAWTAADLNKNGSLEASESARYEAMLRLKGKPLPANTTLSQPVFIEQCKTGVFDAAAMDPAAPLKGANSFTEGQAKDWVTSSGFTNVSAMTKDADGIWRGSASRDGKSMSVAVDFKGNVVASN